MKSELLLRLWQLSQSRLQTTLSKLTPENTQNRLTPGTASVGFILMHIAEAQLLQSKIIFGTEADFTPFTVATATDDGRRITIESIGNRLKQAAETVSKAIRNLHEDQCDNPVGVSPRAGSTGIEKRFTLALRFIKSTDRNRQLPNRGRLTAY